MYSNTVDEAPKAQKVGDIIRLRRFHFVLSEKGELIAYETHFSNWLIYKGGKGESDTASNYKLEWETKNHNRSLTTFEQKRLHELREWSADFFGQHKIKFITWWSPLIQPANEKEAVEQRLQSTDVDIILKATEVRAKENQIYFIDHENKKYQLTLKANPVLQPNKVIKLRCVNIIYHKDYRIILLTNKSSCLLIPDNFYDATSFGKKTSPKGSVAKTPQRFSKTPDKSASRTPERKSVQPKSKSPTPARATPTATPIAAKVDFSSEYDISTKKGDNQITAIKKSYAKTKATSVRDLLDILEDPAAHEHKRFVVKGYILGFSQEKLSQIAKKQAGKTVVAYDQKAKNVSNYLYHFTIQLKDGSVEDSDDLLNAYVLTNESDQHLFDCWGILPSTSDVEAWDSLPKAKVSSFEKRFHSLKTGNHEGRFVVELLITGTGKPFFKVYDTIFV